MPVCAVAHAGHNTGYMLQTRMGVLAIQRSSQDDSVHPASVVRRIRDSTSIVITEIELYVHLKQGCG